MFLNGYNFTLYDLVYGDEFFWINIITKLFYYKLFKQFTDLNIKYIFPASFPLFSPVCFVYFHCMCKLLRAVSFHSIVLFRYSFFYISKLCGVLARLTIPHGIFTKFLRGTLKHPAKRDLSWFLCWKQCVCVAQVP